MSLTGKNTLSIRRQDVAEQKSTAIAIKKLTFAHKATLGDTGINLSALTTPTEMSTAGFVNPSAADLLACNVLFNRRNVTLISSIRGVLMDYLSYDISTSSRINFQGFTALENEIFIGVVDPVAKTDLKVVDAQPIVVSGDLAIGVTDFNVGVPFETNKYPSQQVGAVVVYRNGVQQFRNPNNGTTGGNYQEVSSGGALGTLIRFNSAPAGQSDSVLVVSVGLLAERPDGSMMAVIENLAGQIDAMVPTLADLAGVAESTFQSTPNSIDLKQFGDQVISHETKLNTYVGENLSTLRQYNLTVTSGSGTWTTTRAVAVPYLTLDNTWRVRFNFAGSFSVGVTSPRFTVNLTFKSTSGYNQALCVGNSAVAGGIMAFTVPTVASNNIITESVQAAGGWFISGDVELESKPTFIV